MFIQVTYHAMKVSFAKCMVAPCQFRLFDALQAIHVTGRITKLRCGSSFRIMQDSDSKRTMAILRFMALFTCLHACVLIVRVIMTSGSKPILEGDSKSLLLAS